MSNFFFFLVAIPISLIGDFWCAESYQSLGHHDLKKKSSGERDGK